MKKNIELSMIMLFILQLIICTNLKAQEINEWVSYSQKIPVKEYAGKQFRMSASVKTAVDDDSASARLWLRVDNGKRMSFFDNMEDRPIRNAAWNTYSIKGKIDSGMLNIAFGVFCTYNGKFYFDDISIEIETGQGKWEKIFNADFENDKQDFVQGIQLRDQGLNANFIATIETSQNRKKEKYLLITGTGLPNYGINNKAGNYVHVNGIELYYEIYGEGYPLVVLHGNGGSIKDATPFYPELVKKYKIITVDSRAQGKIGGQWRRTYLCANG